MKENNIGISLTKILEEGELLAQNINRGVQVCKKRNTLESVNRVVNKVNRFYEKTKDVKFTGLNLFRIINIFKAILEALFDLKKVKDSIIENEDNLSPSPSI